MTETCTVEFRVTSQALDFAGAVLACAHGARAAFGAAYDWGGNGFPLSGVRALQAALVTRDPQPPA